MHWLQIGFWLAAGAFVFLLLLFAILMGISLIMGAVSFIVQLCRGYEGPST